MTAYSFGTAFIADLDDTAREMTIRRISDGSSAGTTSLPASFAADLRILADEVDRRRGRLPLS
mgnify:CR=1 FL=1